MKIVQRIVVKGDWAKLGVATKAAFVAWSVDPVTNWSRHGGEGLVMNESGVG